VQDDLHTWVGRQQTATDTFTPTSVVALNATLDHDPMAAAPGQVLPYLWHWLYFLPHARMSDIGPDGHPYRGGFLPPVALPRRMWAGSQFSFNAPLRVGDVVQRSSTIDSVNVKQGRTGQLVFVKVRHELQAQGAAQPNVVEFHDIVYRGAKQPGDAEPAPTPAPGGAQWQREWRPDEVMLFRYSALTFNGHRIHYDRAYTTGEEGYPGLVVHGPLIATLLMDLLRRECPQADVASFRFKAVRPTFDGHPMRVSARQEGSTVHLWAQDHEGWLTMDAQATLR
jgi:3-methylfumaryl-CoA hydratase